MDVAFDLVKKTNLWGKEPKRFKKLLSLLKTNYTNEINACIVGCADGKYLLPIAREGIAVTGYEIDPIVIDGGDVKVPHVHLKSGGERIVGEKTKKINGLRNRLVNEGLENFVDIYMKDFYKSDDDDKYNLVFTSSSIHYSINNDLTLEQKVAKLQQAVKPGGIVAIDYFLFPGEVPKKFRSNECFRLGEMETFFNSDWEIVKIRENKTLVKEGPHPGTPFEHFHRFGYIWARNITH